MKTSWTFATAYAVTGNHLEIACAADIHEDFARYTSLYRWVDEDWQRGWFYENVEWRAVSVCALVPAIGEEWWICALSEDGELLMQYGTAFNEKIPGAGVHCDDSRGWGYLSDLQQIGDHLYACGYCGQVYKRHGLNDWRHMDSELLQAPDTPADKSIALSVINGAHENAIYAAGYEGSAGHPPKAFFWNGKSWRELHLPPVAEGINNLFIENEQRIWMCGSNGTLLLGNAADGFKSLSTVNDNQWFLSICKFQEKIYLGSNLGLFVYDPNDHKKGIVEVVTGMSPELQDANIVDCAGDILWSIGPKDIARFDGTTWTRIHHPDNERIGA